MKSTELATAILAGELPAAAAIGRTDAYDALNAGATGRLPFLGSSTKIDAALGQGILTRVLYMEAAGASGRQACAFRSAGCEAACLVEFTGRMSMNAARRARRRRHASFYADRTRFLADLASEIAHLEREAKRKGMRPAVRLNGTTDLPWERMRFGAHRNLMEAFPNVQFYDYTKFPLNKRGPLPDNYHLTYSFSEKASAPADSTAYLDNGFSVAVVFQASKGNLPVQWRGRRVIDGDKTDARFTDAPGCWVGLSAKGRAKTDTSGFVQGVI